MKKNLLPCPLTPNGRHWWVMGHCEHCGESRHKFSRELKVAQRKHDRERKAIAKI